VRSTKCFMPWHNCLPEPIQAAHSTPAQGHSQPQRLREKKACLSCRPPIENQAQKAISPLFLQKCCCISYGHNSINSVRCRTITKGYTRTGGQTSGTENQAVIFGDPALMSNLLQLFKYKCLGSYGVTYMIKSLQQFMLIFFTSRMQKVMEIVLSITCTDSFPFHTIAGLITEVARKLKPLSNKVLETSESSLHNSLSVLFMHTSVI